ncbi:MAG: hypothetical protein AB7N70_34945 [Dehalococcoidia bacterium]
MTTEQRWRRLTAAARFATPLRSLSGASGRWARPLYGRSASGQGRLALRYLLLTPLVAGCIAEPYRLTGMRGGPTFYPQDSIELRFPANASLGTRLRFARDAAGRHVVVDTGQWRLFYFDSRGTLLSNFSIRSTDGSSGDFASGPAILPGDSLVAVHDWGTKEIRVYGLGDGAERSRTPAPVRTVGQNWSWRGDTAFVGAGLSEALVAEWRTAMRTVVPRGETPAASLANSGKYFAHGPPEVVARDSSLIVAVPMEPGLWVLNREGQVTSRLTVPALLRRGTPPGYREAETAPRRSRWLQMTGSAVRGLFLRPSGELLLWYADRDLMTRDSIREPRQGNFRSYISIVSATLEQVCLDAPLPASADTPHVLAVSGDTVEVLARRDTALGNTRLILGRYTVSTGGCDWVPTGQ